MILRNLVIFDFPSFAHDFKKFCLCDKSNVYKILIVFEISIRNWIWIRLGRWGKEVTFQEQVRRLKIVMSFGINTNLIRASELKFILYLFKMVST